MRRTLTVLALAFGLFLLGAGAAQASSPDVAIHHTLAWDETVANVAVRFGVPLNALVDANGIDDLYRVAPGRWLSLPLNGSEPAGETVTYTVRAGDTLSGIATAYGTTVDALVAANAIADPSNITTGQVLIISGSNSDPVTVDIGPLHGIETLPAPVKQGQVLVIEASVDAGTAVMGQVGGQSVAFVRDGDKVFGMLPIGLFDEPGARTLTLWVGSSRAERLRADATVQVAVGHFPSDIISVPPDRTYLLDPAILAEDREKLTQAFSVSTVKRLWGDTFLEPITGTLTSAFGSRRVYNSGQLESVHGGMDISGNIGTPVQAANAGRVVLAGTTQVYGNAVILDHGLGLCTAYFHLESIGVEIGQRVERGQIVGYVGNTGLSTGAHLHWEMRLNDVPVDPMQWVFQSIP